MMSTCILCWVVICYGHLGVVVALLAAKNTRIGGACFFLGCQGV
jgi:hypothetical protein